MGFLSRAQAAFLSTAERLAFLGPTLARLTLGVVFIGTGWGKLHGLQKVTEFFTELGIPAPGFNAVLASTALDADHEAVEVRGADGAGIDLLGFEEWTYIVLAVWILVAGPGPLSLDRILQNVLWRPRTEANTRAATV